MKKLFIVAASLLASQAHSQVCQLIQDENVSITINHPETGKQDIPVAKLTAHIDVIKREVCFSFRGLEALRTEVTPAHACLDIDSDSNDPKVTVTLPNGEAIDVSGSFSAAFVRPWFDNRYKQCLERMKTMAKNNH